jgi:hypothetical protein
MSLAGRLNGTGNPELEDHPAGRIYQVGQGASACHQFLGNFL